MVTYPAKSLASKEREAKIKSKYRVSDEVNEAQIKKVKSYLPKQEQGKNKIKKRD
jgi:hypothetical protein